MRFLLRWQHAAPGAAAPRPRRRAGRDRPAPGLRARRRARGRRRSSPRASRATSSAGSRTSASRARSSGVGFAPASADRRGTARRGAATPVARDPDHVRAARGPPLAPASGARRRASPRSPPTARRASVLDALRSRGAMFHAELRSATGPPARRGRGRAVGPGRARPRHRRRLPGRALAVLGAREPGSAASAHEQRRRARGAAGALAGARAAKAAGRCCRRAALAARERSTADPDASPSRSPGSCSPVGASSSGTSWRARRSRFPGARCSGRCAASRRAAWCAAGASSRASPASSTRCPRPSKSCAGAPRGQAASETVRLSAADPLNVSGVVLPGGARRRAPEPVRHLPATERSLEEPPERRSQPPYPALAGAAGGERDGWSPASARASSSWAAASAGLQAVKALHGADADVTLIDRNNYHLFQPLSYQVATGSLSPGDIAVPLRRIVRHERTRARADGRGHGVRPRAPRADDARRCARSASSIESPTTS